MDAMVSARVPVEIQKQGDSKLKEIGSSATELVNAAYKYVLEHGKLPGQEEEDGPEQPRTKTLSGTDALAFSTLWNRRAVLEAKAYDGDNFKELLEQARKDYYARLA